MKGVFLMRKNINNLIDIMALEEYEKFFTNDSYENFKDSDEAYNDVYKLFWNNKAFENVRFDLEDSISKTVILFEKQGFILGFKKAMDLLEKGGYVK